ncbi:hypothetical protein MNBD_GAMMA04-457 [hydrothermal vent metagenome]|uniref:Uncharacterized protein n=1 Tax=hydrothermal vent metagenome TaxID=652676 RepID=A0A3B0WDS8_9ZZZZ
MNTHKKRPTFWLILIGSIFVLALLITFQPEREKVNPNHLPWNAHYDETGQLHALGLVLNKSTLRDAMDLYGKDVEVKIFSSQNDENKSIEAYFPVMYIGAIKAALALKIELSPEELEQAYNEGKAITTNPSGTREISLYTATIAKYFDHPLSSITLLPRKHLTEQAIQKRFGEADKKEIQSDRLPHWFFYEKGLEMIIDDEGPEALQYSTSIRPTPSVKQTKMPLQESSK